VYFVVGGSSFLAAVTVFLRHEWSALLSAGGGPHHDRLEGRRRRAVPTILAAAGLFIAIGLVVFGLATSLWMTEYQGRHFPGGYVSHA